ncbi:MAG TPA: hypothetical protein VGH24_12585 [Solirubrobacteraceae bacterium]
MALVDPIPVREGPPRCAYCGGVIGVYEPAIQLLGDVAVTTSRASDPDLSASSPGLLYHAVCHELSQRHSAT